jgi:glycosyltransferase involved in cell wall biosynthesis
MDIGVFCPTLNVYGGGELVSAVIANTLVQNDYNVIFFTNEEVNQQETKKFFGENLDSSIKVIVQPSRLQPRGLFDDYQTIFRSHIFKSKCDMWIDVYSCRIFPWTNVSYIHFPSLNHHVYGSKFPYLKSRHIRPVGTLPYAIFEKNLTNDNGKLILANSQYTADEIRKFSGKKAEVLHPPVLSSYFNNPAGLVENRRENLVVTVSRFDLDKGLEKILHLALLTEPNIQFALIGRAECQNTLHSLQELAKQLGLTDRIRFFTDVPRVEMKAILERAKIYLHTKIGEHFGIAIAEAMAMGCIPIVHDSGGAKEFVPQEFRYSSIREAAAKISKETYEWSPRKTMESIKIARKFREENFSKEFTKLFRQYTGNAPQN